MPMNEEPDAGVNAPAIAPVPNPREPADICGCVPAPGQEPGAVRCLDENESAGGTDPQLPMDTHEGRPLATTVRPSRTLKVVLTLRPGDGPSIAALLAVGAEGCDPLIRSITAGDLSTVLAEIPSLLAEAEARWVAQPRYATIAPPSRAKGAGRRREPEHPVQPTPGDQPATQEVSIPPADPDGRAPDEPDAERKAAPTAQLSFFE
jgi:hypothetical protein